MQEDVSRHSTLVEWHLSTHLVQRMGVVLAVSHAQDGSLRAAGFV